MGDLDGDGLLDLVTAWSNPYTPVVTVLRGRRDGTFTDRVDYSAWPGARAVALGDLNGDGSLDVVTAMSSPLSALFLYYWVVATELLRLSATTQ